MLPPGTDLDDEQVSDVIQAVGGAEIVGPDRPVDMLASALWYTDKLHWPIFPLKPRGKTPLTTHGFKDASTDRVVVEAWFRRWPDANIGVPTGPSNLGGCGYDVLDIDGPDGMDAWAKIKHAGCDADCSDETYCAAPGPFDIKARAFTPGGPGRHMFIEATGRGNATRMFGQSMDYRGAGGYVVCAPSVGLSGVRYRWITRPAVPR